ncbi:hypothetical protein EHN06_09460 [Marinobacter sp. NP-4(2019)]|uniref:hypothetical protein n=1 Tax=Marinobacter sp. NP-4(2019) TaxID=2488665 RepID=UPI000FC3D6F3|nr:hypothetical protein [Marinobacter sp. NP-4(2019)]AZT83751.1 hypothetical protein EHN06_09460 [Marinobacter sp. NP-4(2019)]
MRADSLSRIVSLVRGQGLLLLLVLITTGCKTEKSADDPTVLGVPPSEAYLGVEYYYNFGAYGGERILDFSLTNAPSWLALEETRNKARPGVIIRGVPGLSGGNRGDADLGKIENINLITTDGERTGVQPFGIEVKRNPLSLDADTFVEGQSTGSPEASDNRCEAPELGDTGAHSYTANLYDSDGAVTDTEVRTSDTHPVLVRVLLDQPSVTRVAVAFELSSDFDPDVCDQGFDPEHQRCEEGEANHDEAVIGKDIVALGSGSEGALPVPDYLNYQQDGYGVYSRGVITLEPGITECYIRLEVVDDTLPEASESLQLTLTEVRSGLASLGPSDSGMEVSLNIDDNEPTVRLETVGGRQRDALSVGTQRQYVAVLSGDRAGTVRVKLGETVDSLAKTGDYGIQTQDKDGNWQDNDVLRFPEDVARVRFRVKIPDEEEYSNAGMEDRFLILGVDQDYQAGRAGFAGTAEDGELRININELVAPLILNDEDAFVPTDLAVGHEGRLYVAGYDDANNDQVLVRIFNQKGALLQEVAVSDGATVLDKPHPVIHFAQRQVTQGSTRVDRFEFVVAYGAGTDMPGHTSHGGMDMVASLYWFDSAAAAGNEYSEVWTIRTGTSADDVPRWVGINKDSGFVAIAGETGGRWPGESRAGGVDSFLQRIDTEIDGDNRVPRLAWTRQIGSSQDETVVSGSTVNAIPYLFGASEGAVATQNSAGSTDVFFYSVAGADITVNVYQRGTDGSEAVVDGLNGVDNLWLLGNSDRLYTIDDSDDTKRLNGEPVAGTTGFVLGYSSSGEVDVAFSYADGSRTGKETFAALLAFDEDLIAGGATTGAFADKAVDSGIRQPVLARISPADFATNGDENPDSWDIWRVQPGIDDANIAALANYRDDEIVTLVRETVGAESEWKIVLFSGEGTRLN